MTAGRRNDILLRQCKNRQADDNLFGTVRRIGIRDGDRGIIDTRCQRIAVEADRIILEFSSTQGMTAGRRGQRQPT